MWGRAYADCRIFQQSRIAITQAEIGNILAVWVADGTGKNSVLYEAGCVVIVPVDPTKALAVSNSAIVATTTRRVLMKQWKKTGKEMYCKTLQGIHASEQL